MKDSGAFHNYMFGKDVSPKLLGNKLYAKSVLLYNPQ